jgi:two-component system, cell cycle sensor histidine kinase and response regulator CckA
MAELESTIIKQLQRQLLAATETIESLKSAADSRMAEPGGEELAVAKAIATLQNSLAVRSQELLHTEARFRALFEHSPLMAFTIDQTGKITHANQVAIEALDIPLPDLKKSFFASLFLRESAIRLKNANETTESEIPGLNMVGGREVDLTVAPIPGVQERQVLLHDVTQQRLVEKQLHHAQQMDAVGQLAGGVAHDFNNQLCGIVGYAELLKLKPFADDPKVQKYLQNILTACSRAEDLVTALLAFSRRGRMESNRVDINQVINGVIDIASHTFDRRITIARDLRAESAYVMGDASQLESALLNLALNARDAMPEGGELSIKTQIYAGSAGQADKLDIYVRDNGSGMSPGVLTRIYEPFFTTKPLGKGTGIGLAAVYGTVQGHGGSIDVQSEVGLGSTFHLRFPLAQGPEFQHSQTPKLRSGRGSILLVDDDEAVRESSQELLVQLGYQVQVAASGTEALSLFQSSHQDFDLVILDLVMPDIHGSEVLSAMRKISPTIPVLLISGFSAMELEYPSDGYLPKPFTAAAFSTAISTLLHQNHG